MTTRSKGTGLGLAIVRKIMEDHGGDLRLEDGPEEGARVSLLFPVPEDRPKKATKLRDKSKRRASIDDK